MSAALPDVRRIDWTVELRRRLRRLLVLKSIGISAFIGLFFAAYFQLLRHPAFAVTLMPVTALDRWVVFEPAALPAYLSLWLYVALPPGLLTTARELLAYGLRAAALCAAGLACFYFWPTAVPTPDVGVARHAGLAFLQRLDAAGNACPSMHVAAAAFTMLQLRARLAALRWPAPLQWLNLAWCGAIAYSTLAVKQHVLVDVAAGALLGALFALPFGERGDRASR